jgi:hypothetical protein
MKTIESSKGAITLRNIKLKDSREARSYANRTGEWNEQDYFTKLYFLLADKDKVFLDELNHADDIKLIGAVKSLIEDSAVGDAKKQL